MESVHSVTVPGAISLFEEVANKFGNLGLKELCEQPIKYAEEGVVVSPRVSFDWEVNIKKLLDLLQRVLFLTFWKTI